jgi:hypothetical protein
MIALWCWFACTREVVFPTPVVDSATTADTGDTGQ